MECDKVTVIRKTIVNDNIKQDICYLEKIP